MSHFMRSTGSADRSMTFSTSPSALAAFDPRQEVPTAPVKPRRGARPPQATRHQPPRRRRDPFADLPSTQLDWRPVMQQTAEDAVASPAPALDLSARPGPPAR